MGGKSTQSTQSVSIPPEVMARYNAVNARAEEVASTPFKQYGTTPEAFVAPLTATQQAGIAGTNAAAQQAQPYYQAATQQLMGAQAAGQQGVAQAGQTLAGAQQVGQELGGQAYQGISSVPSIAAPYYGQAERMLAGATGAGQAGLGAATGYALAGAQGVSPEQFSGQAINQYMSPFMSNVVNQTMAAQAQQNAQQRAALTSDAIKAGAFGGDRSGIAQANLAYQQNLANQQTLANLYQQGYGQALGAFQQQQGVNLAAEQANRAALQQTGQSLAGLAQGVYGMGSGAAQQLAGYGQNLAGLGLQTGQALAGLGQQQFGQGATTAQQQAALAQQQYGMGAGTSQALAGLGTGAQAAALQGAQAQLGAGTVQQQTEQAGKQALYNQFLQQQGYPFQVAQFLANIAMGTGALSGSTTTTTQPTSFFSDKRLKEGVEPIGETYDGQKIVKFNYKGSPAKQIGLIAQDVEKHHPEAVGVASGYKTVNYDEATKDAAKLGHRSEGGGVVPSRSGEGFAAGGYAVGGGTAFDADMIRQILANQQGQYAQMYGQSGAPHGVQGAPGATGRVPAANLPVGRLATPSSAPREQASMLSQGMSAAATGEKIADLAQKAKSKYDEFTKKEEPAADTAPKPGIAAAAPAPASPVANKVSDAGGLLESAPGGGKIDVADLAADESEDLISNALSFAWTGGRIKKAGGGDAESEDTSAPEGIYKPQGAGINIPDENSKHKPLEPAKPPQPGKSGLSEITDAVKTAAKVASMFFLADGGVVPRAHKARGGADVLEGEILPREEEQKPKGLVRLAAANTNTASDAPPVGASAPPAGVAPKAPEPSNFDRSVNRTFQFEGGLNKADTNGMPSLYGINAKYHPDFFQNPSKEKAAQIYKSQYWDAIGGDKLDPKLAHVAFDTAVIAGPAKAKQLMAQAGGDPAKLLELRKNFQDSLIAKDPNKYGKYEKAWNNRVATLYNDISGEGAPTPAAAAPGVAGPGQRIRTASNAPFSTITEGILPADTSRKTRDILTSENLWVPALAGIGSMLASKSPTLGPAIGEGLVGATAAYTGLNKQQADIAQTGAQTEKVMADIAGEAFKTDPNGITRVRYVRPDGSYDFMPLSEWSRLRREGKAPKLDPRVERLAVERAAEEEKRFVPQGAAGAAPAGQPAAQPTGAQPQITQGQTQYQYIDTGIAKQAAKEAEILMDTPNAALADQKDVFAPQQTIATNAAAQKQSLLPFGGALAALPADKDPLAGGEAQKVLGPVVNVLQGIGNVFGFEVTDPSKIANYEEVKKEVARLRAQMAQAGNQSAVSALDRLGEGLPSNLNTKEAQARLYSTLLIANQREIDKNNFFNEWFEAARGPDGENSRVASRTGRLATTKFDEKYNQEFYNSDKKNLEKVFRADVEMPDGTKQNLMYMLTQANKPLPQELKDAIAQKYGDRIFRYFNIPYTPSAPKKKAQTGSSVG